MPYPIVRARRKQRWHRAPLGCKGALDNAAPVVTAHDDVFDAQIVDGELQYGKNIHVTGVHDVRNVAMDEHLAWVEAQHVVCGHAAIGATDPELARRLLLGHPTEEVRIVLPLSRGPGNILIQQVVQGPRHKGCTPCLIGTSSHGLVFLQPGLS